MEYHLVSTVHNTREKEKYRISWYLLTGFDPIEED
jgi:hypothetical protein